MGNGCPYCDVSLTTSSSQLVSLLHSLSTSCVTHVLYISGRSHVRWRWAAVGHTAVTWLQTSWDDCEGVWPSSEGHYTMGVRYRQGLTHWGLVMPQYIGSSLVHAMLCCLAPPSHYPSQCGLNQWGPVTFTWWPGAVQCCVTYWYSDDHVQAPCIYGTGTVICLNYCTWREGITALTHCGPVTPYGDIDLGQRWLR